MILSITTNDSTLKSSASLIMMKTKETQRQIKKCTPRMSLILLIKKWKLYKDIPNRWSRKMTFECGFSIMIFISINSQSFKKSFRNFWLNTQVELTRQQKSRDLMSGSKTGTSIIWGLNFQDSTFIICLTLWLKISCKKKSNIDSWLSNCETN